MKIDLQIFINILLTASIYLLIAYSYSLIYFTTKIFHLSHAATITFGAYFVYFFANKFSLTLLPAILLSILATTLLGVTSEVLVYRYMRKKNSPLLAYLIASIGIYLILQNCISMYFGDDPKIINMAKVAVGHLILGGYITTIQIVIIVVSSVLFVLVNLFMHFSLTGKTVRAVASNPQLSDIYGIESNKIILICFAIGSGLAASAGILSAMDTSMTPTFGFDLLFYGIVAMIVGGIGSNKGLIIGSFLIATIQSLVAYYFDIQWMESITYVILILFLVWKPLGFSGQRLKKVEV